MSHSLFHLACSSVSEACLFGVVLIAKACVFGLCWLEGQHAWCRADGVPSAPYGSAVPSTLLSHRERRADRLLQGEHHFLCPSLLLSDTHSTHRQCTHTYANTHTNTAHQCFCYRLHLSPTFSLFLLTSYFFNVEFNIKVYFNLWLFYHPYLCKLSYKHLRFVKYWIFSFTAKFSSVFLKHIFWTQSTFKQWKRIRK